MEEEVNPIYNEQNAPVQPLPQSNSSWFRRPWLLTIVLALIVLGIISAVIILYPSTKVNEVSPLVHINATNAPPVTKIVASNVNLAVNTNIHDVKCDGSKNTITLAPGYMISLLQITNTDEQQITDLRYNGLINSSYTLLLPMINGSWLTSSYNLVTDPSMNGTDMSQISQNTTEFLTISNATGVDDLNDTVDTMIRTWQSRSGQSVFNFGYTQIFVNQNNESQDIFYTCIVQ